MHYYAVKSELQIQVYVHMYSAVKCACVGSVASDRILATTVLAGDETSDVHVSTSTIYIHGIHCM